MQTYFPWVSSIEFVPNVIVRTFFHPKLVYLPLLANSFCLTKAAHSDIQVLFCRYFFETSSVPTPLFSVRFFVCKQLLDNSYCRLVVSLENEPKEKQRAKSEKFSGRRKNLICQSIIPVVDYSN